MIDRTPYSRQVFYYETDQMSIVHHSNYIRWMEEARMHALRINGISCRAMEEENVMIPVVDASCHYRIPAKYDENLSIETKLVEFNGIRMEFLYKIYSTDSGALLADGHSVHCFIDSETRLPVNLKRRLPEYYEAISRLVETDAADKNRR